MLFRFSLIKTIVLKWLGLISLELLGTPTLNKEIVIIIIVIIIIIIL